MRHPSVLAPLARWWLSLAVAVAATACGAGPDASGGASPDSARSTAAAPLDAPPRDTSPVTGEVVVSAAASLTDAFAAIEAAFEQVHRASDVVLNLAGSSTLREQILAGAPVDVFASASTDDLAPAVDAGLTAGDPQVFARNRLQIAVPAGNPAGVDGLEDFADPDLFLGLCAPDVPCGELARQALASAGVTPAADTNEPDVRALVTKVAAGELDAGITYVTDVVAAGAAVAGVGIPAAHNVTAIYPIVALHQAPNPDGAAAFVAFVLSDRGRALVADHGFATP